MMVLVLGEGKYNENSKIYQNQETEIQKQSTSHASLCQMVGMADHLSQ